MTLYGALQARHVFLNIFIRLLLLLLLLLLPLLFLPLIPSVRALEDLALLNSKFFFSGIKIPPYFVVQPRLHLASAAYLSVALRGGRGSIFSSTITQCEDNCSNRLNKQLTVLQPWAAVHTEQ